MKAGLTRGLTLFPQPIFIVTAPEAAMKATMPEARRFGNVSSVQPLNHDR